MSGGDLDGDLYLVIWDEALVPAQEDPPLDYTPAQKPQPIEGAARFVLPYDRHSLCAGD
jgi:RNA dependent RNA polymerase